MNIHTHYKHSLLAFLLAIAVCSIVILATDRPNAQLIHEELSTFNDLLLDSEFEDLLRLISFDEEVIQITPWEQTEPSLPVVMHPTQEEQQILAEKIAFRAQMEYEEIIASVDTVSTPEILHSAATIQPNFIYRIGLEIYRWISL